MDKHERKEAIDYLVYNYHLNKELLYRYAVIEKIKNGYLVCIYKDYKNDIKYYEVK
jgi:hypothetical protein